MKKDESFKSNNTRERILVKNEMKIQALKSKAPKTFLGCNTCKLKNASIKKTEPPQEDQVKIKRCAEINHNDNKRKIKLTDLCEQDKKRIVELMEELFKFAEKNRSLRESLECVEKAKKNQHECFVKQTSLYLEEKNMFLKEIQTYKARLETYEGEMKEKLEKWEYRERFMDNEIRYLTKTLQKSFVDKLDLMKENSYLKKCLKKSLKSFELLRNEVSSLQQQSLKSGRASSQTMLDNEDKKEKIQNEESEDESLPITAKDTPSCKTDLDVINNKFEQIYSLLGNKKEFDKTEKIFLAKKGINDSEIRIPEKMKSEKEGNFHNFIENGVLNNVQDVVNRMSIHQEGDVYGKKKDDSHRLLENCNHDNSTSIQTEKVLKKIGKLFSFKYDEKVGKEYVVEEDSQDNSRGNTDLEEGKRIVSFRKNVDGKVDDENRLLNDLFYSNAMVDLGLESALLLTNGREFDHSNSNLLK